MEKINLARRTTLQIKYENKDISKDLAKYLKSFSYTDIMSGQADSIDITLEDKDGLWQGDWLPEKGATVEVTLRIINWQGDNQEQELKLGLFEIDEIESSGKPSEVKIKGVSVPNNSALRGEDKSRSWEKTNLKVVATDIAVNAKMELFYDIDDNIKYERVEQTEQSDLSFLLKLCSDAGLALKITDKQIIIFDEEVYEKEDTIYKITKMNIKSYSIKSSLRDIYRACKVKYQNQRTKTNLEYLFELPDKQGKILVINEHVEDYPEAEKLAKKKLREKNCEEVQMTVSMMGEINLFAGATVDLESFGKFDGKYIVTKASHSLDNNGYATGLEMRKVLDGY